MIGLTFANNYPRRQCMVACRFKKNIAKGSRHDLSKYLDTITAAHTTHIVQLLGLGSDRHFRMWFRLTMVLSYGVILSIALALLSISRPHTLYIHSDHRLPQCRKLAVLMMWRLINFFHLKE